ncbi:hypothetical protein CEXT_407881 [Caerostris extrusa]|uniref:Uncharacterized protein n=1 Tax=Caerostris extrusa TaxID=172846 RepID=A0AAV4W4K0_CAEEX|nr:hypothetical protein CEXT_407881 [Caerostris extrusa]
MGIKYIFPFLLEAQNHVLIVPSSETERLISLSKPLCVLSNSGFFRVSKIHQIPISAEERLEKQALVQKQPFNVVCNILQLRQSLGNLLGAQKRENTFESSFVSRHREDGIRIDPPLGKINCNRFDSISVEIAERMNIIGACKSLLCCWDITAGFHCYVRGC